MKKTNIMKYNKGDKFKGLTCFGDCEIIEVMETSKFPYCIKLKDSGNEWVMNDKELEKDWILIEETKQVEKMDIENNKHHELWNGVQSIDIMEAYLTKQEYIGFLKGTILKYQLRLGKKDNNEKEIAKIADYRRELDHKLKCV